MINLFKLAKTLFPIHRSITGQGVVQSLKIIQKEIKSLKIKKIKSGKKVFDWKIPPEWNVKNAYVLDKYNNKIIDIKNSNLHLVSYSHPIRKIITRDQLFERLHFQKNKKMLSLM